MSLESEIEEDILEEEEDPRLEDDNTESDKHVKLEDALEKHVDEKRRTEDLTGIGGNEIKSENTTHKKPLENEGVERRDIRNITDVVNQTTIAIINYSQDLADSVLKEALLITDIYTRDSLNMSGAVNYDVIERDKDIRKNLFPENGRIVSDNSEAGYDNYLIDKLLRSKPDPDEMGGTEGFDGKEDHFKTDDEHTYPDIENDEPSDTEFMRSDKNNNNNKSGPGILNSALGLIDPFDENILQTIHEDKELVITGSESSGSAKSERGVKEVRPALEQEMLPLADDLASSLGADKILPADNVTEEASWNNDSGHVEDLQEAEDGEAYNDIDDEDDDEPDCCEMTFKQKKVMVQAVRRGDIAHLERLLEKKNADMNMLWYGESLLMVAIRANQQEMAEFLIDNGINWKHEKNLVEIAADGAISVQKITAREMAFDVSMDDLVEQLDQKNDNLFPFVRPRPRAPRLRQPIIPFMPPPLDEGMRAEFMVTPEEAREVQKEARRQHFERLREAAREAERQELERINAQRKKRGLLGADEDGESVQMSKSRQTFSDVNVLHDDISQVFGPDEGYETMSPVSHYPRYDKYHVHDLNEPVSIRATRAFHLKKAFNASKAGQLKRMESPDYPMYNNNMIESVGSYSFESRHWHQPTSAHHNTYLSQESLHDTDVHIGLPFVHGKPFKSASARSRGKPTPSSVQRRRTQSAHNNISPYSQVARLLEQSRLFSPVSSSRSSTPNLPAIPSKRSADWALTKTRMNYIYANRSSAKTTPSDINRLRSELLPKRKVFAR